jgi:DNA (cytosine-5)-methyltransferase 1
MITFGSLFSGIGGFDRGFELSGMKSSWQCEIDKKCQSVLSRHFGVKIYDDVRSIARGNTEPVDVICGGFPCQDVSIAGKRKGLAGDRSGLWSEFARIIDELKPRWVVIENVPGLLSSNQGRDFQTVIDQMVEFGYGVSWRILDAQYFGVAQRRRRVFIVGSLGNGNSAKVLFESEGVCWDTPTRGKTGEGIAKSINVGTGSRCNPTDTTFSISGIGEYKQGIGTLRSNGGDLGGGSENIVIAYENHPADSRITETGDISQQLTSRMGTGGGNVPLVARCVTSREGMRNDPETETLIPSIASTLAGGSSKCHSDITSGQGDGNVIAIDWQQSGGNQENLSNTLSVTRTQAVGLRTVGVRRLTPVECERLQGFQDGWTSGQSDSTRYKQLGNAVAVPVAEWIGKRIVEVENDELR